MLPSRHIMYSGIIALIFYFITKSILASLTCLFFGFIIDIDHIIEYGLQFNWKSLTLKKVYHASMNTGTNTKNIKFAKLYLIFHSIELALILWFLYYISGNIYLAAIAVGYSSHILLDIIGNNHLKIHAYFIIWRFLKKWNPDLLFKKKFLDAQKDSMNYEKFRMFRKAHLRSNE